MTKKQLFGYLNEYTTPEGTTMYRGKYFDWMRDANSDNNNEYFLHLQLQPIITRNLVYVIYAKRKMRLGSRVYGCGLRKSERIILRYLKENKCRLASIHTVNFKRNV